MPCHLIQRSMPGRRSSGREQPNLPCWHCSPKARLTEFSSSTRSTEPQGWSCLRAPSTRCSTVFRKTERSKASGLKTRTPLTRANTTHLQKTGAHFSRIWLPRGTTSIAECTAFSDRRWSVPAHDMQSLDSYLTKLDAALAKLPRTERQEIILETKSHISERLERDSSSSVGEV